MIIAQALLLQDRFRIVEVADEQVEFDKFVFHKLNLINSPLICLFLLLIRIYCKSKKARKNGLLCVEESNPFVLQITSPE